MNLHHITEENFEQVDPNLLADPRWYPEVEAMVISIDAAGTADYARKYATIFAEKLRIAAPRLAEDLSKKYLALLKTLRFYSLQSTPDKEKEVFFSELILDTLRVGFLDINKKLEDFFRGFYDDPQTIEFFKSMFLRALERNAEILGDQNLQIDTGAETKTVRPTLAGWINDYNLSTHLNQDTHRRGGFEQTNYLLHSQNVKMLSKENKDILLKLLQVYDWLRFEKLKFDFRIPGQESWNEEELNFSTAEKVLPEDLVDMLNKHRLEKASTIKEINGLNYMTGQSAVMEPSAVPEITQKELSKPARPKPVPLRPPDLNMPNNPRNLMDIKAEIESRKQKVQEEIDKKLEELRRKVRR